MIDLSRDSRLDDINRQFDELLNCYKRARAEHLAKCDAGTSYEMEGTQTVYKNPKTGEKVVVEGCTKYDVLEAKYESERARMLKMNRMLSHNVKQLKSENEVLHREVNDLGHKFCRARRERDQLAEKLRKAEIEAQKRGSLLEKLSYLIYKETTC